MTRIVVDPPAAGLLPDGTLLGGWWHEDAEHGRIVCDLCPRECHLKPGDRGFCFVRQNIDQQMVLTTYGRSTGFCIDPIEKKPLNHFFPGTSVLSFGTAGCNLGCKFCQNWDISKSREVERLSEFATPDAIVAAAKAYECRSVAFTYNDPIIWAEYAMDTARECRAAGIATVAVTAGYISPVARAAFFRDMDAANVDLKGFTEDFYYKITYSHLRPVLETIEWLRKETNVWVELTNLVIPQTNDSPDEIRQMCEWIVAHCGDDIPVHFSAFHPDFRMRDLPPTPLATLLEAYDIAQSVGLKFVYVGNVDDVAHQSTYCPSCRELIIERNWYELGVYRLHRDRCQRCDTLIPGRFAEQPGNWGRKRLPVSMSRFARPQSLRPTSPTSPTSPTVVEITAMPHPSQPSSPDPAAVEEERPLVTPDQEDAIFKAACGLVTREILHHDVPLPDPRLAGAADTTVMGAFVTLKRQGRLRACCGTLGVPMRLGDAVRQAAIRTATEDTRLPPISPTELPYLSVDVNLLYGFRPIAGRGRTRIQHVTVGRHGLQIRRGNQAGLLLPSVPVEQGWDAETFLRQVCRKAGLPTTAWEDDDVELLTFESREFGGPMDGPEIHPDRIRSASARSRADLEQYSAHARRNLLALLEGATPNYYLPGVADGTVAGVMLSLSGSNGSEPLQVAQWSLRPGIPLQATLFSLCESAAHQLRSPRFASLAAELRSGNACRVGVSIFSDPAMHGGLTAPDLRGFDPGNRILMLVDQGRAAIRFAPRESVDQLLASLTQSLPIADPGQSALYSLALMTTEAELSYSTVPRPVVRASARPPAVAGMFYPGNASELKSMVTELLAASPRQPEVWPLAMVPHAGLIYSGRLAAAVLNRLEFPDTILVIGPKHTPYGVNWAVAPQAQWEIPGAAIASAPDLAQRLVESIPGLLLDAAAHEREHAIEVELPFIARLAPRSRVVGIAIGNASWERCRDFATGLANVLRSLKERPLLLVSSDMNHFATDRENRRLDEIALQAMERLDPAHLLATVRDHSISMCGVLPAVIAMETLRQLGGLTQCQRVGYATSAEVSGDTSRVVGYAGVLMR